MNAALKVVLGTLFLSIVFPANAQFITNQPARWKMKVVCYDGKIGSVISGTSIYPSPEAITPGYEIKDTVTTPGNETQLGFVFVGRNKDKDVYHFTFTRNTKAGVLSKTTSSTECLFDGQQKILFEDELHTIVVESPSIEDLKGSKPRQRH